MLSQTRDLNDKLVLKEGFDQWLTDKRHVERSVMGAIGVPLWVHRVKKAQQARTALAQYVASVAQYDDAMSHRNTHMFPATIGVDTATLEYVHKINAGHDRLRRCLQRMDATGLPVAKQDGKITTRSRQALRRLGYPRLNRKEAFRRWSVLEDTPVYLGLYWARTRKIERIDKQTVIERLDNRLYHPRYTPQEKAQFAQDLQALQCVADEEPLSLIHEHTQPEVNIRLADGRTLRRRAVCPLFFPYKAGQGWPKINGLSDRPKHRQQKVRRDKHWQDTPFIKSLPVFRKLES